MGSGEAELPMAPEAGLGCCQPHSIEWRSSRTDVDGAVSGEVTAVTSALSTEERASG
jgi:hypothetical protein